MGKGRVTCVTFHLGANVRTLSKVDAKLVFSERRLDFLASPLTSHQVIARGRLPLTSVPRFDRVARAAAVRWYLTSRKTMGRFGEGSVPNRKPNETGQRASTVRGFRVVRLLEGASARSTALDLIPTGAFSR